MKKGVIMNKKLINVLLALLLVLSVCLSVSVSASAESGNKPVAWVNFTCSGKIPSHPQVQILAKKLADGSTIGHACFRFLEYDYEINYEVVGSQFSSIGETQIADILMIDSFGGYWCWHMVDNGEPGVLVDRFTAYYYGTEEPSSFPPDTGWSSIMPDQPIKSSNIQVHITDAYQD